MNKDKQLQSDCEKAQKDGYTKTLIQAANFKKGWYYGWNAAKESEWISIKDRVPEESCLVLTVMDGSQDQFISFYKKHRNVFLVYGAGRDPVSDMKVSHWQKLPSPPKE